ncbi:glycosyltransferase family 2 protein [Cyclobacterium salsum]|uniref:glycosyltransferase family 2 protein n=1 Tax=Cyclobacterium salsum TaxID=2666329 RepID=UPI001391135F|nr:glycosyltransferase family A protein [Cyclobacterium salsum]
MKMIKPFLSVILPVYNQERFLVETIESVLCQTYDNFEFLILDDGSTDNSAKIIQSFSIKDPRIKAYYEKNSGKCNSTNKLVEKAKGNWFAFLDADDPMLPKRLEKQMDFHKKNPLVNASSCHCFYINDNGKNIGHQRYPFLKSIEDCDKMLKDNKIILCAFTGLLTSKECYLNTGGLKQKYWPCEDVEFINRIIEKGFKLVIIQDTLMKYRVHSSSITNSNLRHSYVDMNGFVHYCIKLRRKGKEEITFNEFMNIRNKDSSWVKFNRSRAFYAKMFHREAGFSFYTKNYPIFFLKIIAASFLDPNYVLATLKNRLKFSKFL